MVQGQILQLVNYGFTQAPHFPYTRRVRDSPTAPGSRRGSAPIQKNLSCSVLLHICVSSDFVYLLIFNFKCKSSLKHDAKSYGEVLKSSSLATVTFSFLKEIKLCERKSGKGSKNLHQETQFAGHKGKFTLFVVYMEIGNLNWGWSEEGQELALLTNDLESFISSKQMH